MELKWALLVCAILSLGRATLAEEPSANATEIAQCDNDKFKEKDQQIEKLQKNVTQLQVLLQEGAEKIELLDICKANATKSEKDNADIITELKQQVSELKLSIEKQKSDYDALTNKSQTAEKESLKELAVKVEKIKELEAQLTEESKKIPTTIVEDANDAKLPNSCISQANTTGVLKIKVPGLAAFDVLCDNATAGPGWIVIQQRLNGSETFDRNWTTYSEGFGSPHGDFFLGLRKIHRLTMDQRHELYVHMENFEGIIEFARYDQFVIASEQDHYKLLSLGSFSGNVTEDQLTPLIYTKFSTTDRINDACAATRQGGWWFHDCTGT